MKSATHLYIRGQTYWYRFVKGSNGDRTEIRGSLGTSDYAEALRRLADIEADRESTPMKKPFEIDTSNLPSGNPASSPRLTEWRKRQKLIEDALANPASTTADISKVVEAAVSKALQAHTQAQQSKMMLSEAVQKYQAEKISSNNWNPALARTNGYLFSTFLELMSDMLVVNFKREQSVEYVSLLKRVPPRWKSLPKYRGMTIKQAIAANTNGDQAKDSTVNQTITVIGGLFQWLMANNEITVNPFLKLRAKHAESDRLNFTKEQVALLFAPSAFIQLKPHMQWIVYFGAYAALRIGEAVHLYESDIIQDALTGIWYIDINKNQLGKTLKKPSSRRFIPIHQKLIDIDFITFIQSLPKGSRLFPKLTRDYASKNFATYSDLCGLTDHRLSYHSFRHTFKTELVRASVNDRLIDFMCGWKRAESQGDKSYYHKFQTQHLKELKVAIDKLTF